jgi:DNA-binding MarR family transcriptional regulator
MNKSSLLLKDQLCFRLYTASRLLTKVYVPSLENLGLTYPQYLAMLVLWEEDQISVKHLGEKLNLDSGTLSPLIKKLEVKGYVERSRLPFDERVVCLSLTEAGKDLKKKAKKIPKDMFCKTQVSSKELSGLTALIDQLIENLEENN